MAKAMNFQAQDGAKISNVYSLPISLPALQRLMTQQIVNGTALRDQTALIDAAIAAGRVESHLIREKLDKVSADANDTLRPIAENLTATAMELDGMLTALESAIQRLKGNKA